MIIIKIIECVIIAVLFVFVGIPLVIWMGMSDKLTWKNLKKIYYILFR
jgi:hypothetical protein